VSLAVENLTDFRRVPKGRGKAPKIKEEGFLRVELLLN